MKVDNLHQAVAWYTTALGLSVMWRQSLHDVPGAALGLPDQVARLSGAMLSERILPDNRATPAVCGIELHEYREPPVGTGIGHIAFAVADIDDAVTHLAGAGVRFLATPQEIPHGELRGRKWIYGVDPQGVLLELCQHPDR